MSTPAPDELRVLVVDDDVLVARIHARFVERAAGFRAIGVAHDAASALAAVVEHRPDLLLLDVHLPDASGLDVLADLRAGGRDVAVVMVTAERDAAVVRAALHGGAQQYLVKPFEEADLHARLDQVRSALAELRGTPEGVDQAAIDRAFGVRSPGGPVRLPKGLSPETDTLVLAALQEHGELSAAEAGEAVGVSRVSARRYLEHHVEKGDVAVRLVYGGGRPERRYRRSG